MHPTFIAKLKPKKLLDGVFGGEPKVAGAQPGTIPAHVNPPRDAGITQEMITTATVSTGDTGASYAQETPAVSRVAASEPVVAAPATAPAAPSAKPATTSSQPSAMARVGQFLGFRTADASASETATATARPATAAAPPAKSAAEAKPKPAPQPRQVAQSPAEQTPAPQPVAAQAPASATPAVMSGASAPLPTSSFDSRFGAAR
jgi:hypothetical protein